MRTAALIVAAGSSVRFGGPLPKQFQLVAGRPLLAWTIGRFEKATSIDSITLVVAEDRLLYTMQNVINPYKLSKVTNVIPGGESRQESVLKGLERIPPATELVAIHDGARALTDPADIDAVVGAATVDQAAILATKVPDTVKRTEAGWILSTVDRDDLFLAQTPQVFGYHLILNAHRKAAGDEKAVTDDAALIETRGVKVKIVEPRSPNPKVTTDKDIEIVEAILSGEQA